jgi:hypothetical protein
MLFRARYDHDGRAMVLRGEYGVASPAECVRDLPPDAVVLGDGRARHPDVFAAFSGDPQPPVRPDAIARIAAERFARGERMDPKDLRPLYLRRSDPEIRRDERVH